MKRMKVKIIIFVFILAILISNQVSAISSSGGYTIEAYNIDMQVNEDNTFDITETITANFTGYNKHGIYRKIPLKNSVTRTDGTKSNNNAKITNISVNDNFKTSTESGYKVIKIGDANKTVSGAKTYTIKYTYNIGKDPLKNADELYFNLIGDEWDTSISNVTFKITMPKEFDKTLLGFSSGEIGSTNSSNVLYNVNGNVISGSLKNSLSSGEALTVRVTLPEGYFVGASFNPNMYAVITIIISLLFVLISYRLWAKYGKDDKVIETVEFYPPEGFNSAEVGYLYEGKADNKSVISLLIYLANKGYLKIEEIEKKALIGKYKSFKIIKLKEYDGNNQYERIFFEGLFTKEKLIKINDLMENNESISWEEAKQIVNSNTKCEISTTESDLYNSFYKTLDNIKTRLNDNKHEIFESSTKGKGKWLILMIITIFLLITIKPIMESGSDAGDKFGMMEFIILAVGCGFWPISCAMSAIIYRNGGPERTSLSYKISALILGILLESIGIFIFVIATIWYEPIYTLMYIIGIICMIFITLFKKLMPKRTKAGNEMLGKIQGFKRFLETVEKQQLESLVEKNPEYFYDILPYTYALGISDVWIKQFETIALQVPDWYNSSDKFDMKTFEKFMIKTMSSVSSSMSSSPSSDGGSGGSSGGGSSGGGSGGGGGGSW